MNHPIQLTTIIELFHHNYWARDRQLQLCDSLSDDQFRSDLGGSFPSIRDTLVHMVAVEWLWLERWRGNAPTKLLSTEELPTLSAIKQRWINVEKEMNAYLSIQTDSDILGVESYRSTRGQQWTYPLWRMMLHLLNHQSYHRGQITNYLRQLDIEPPKVDFLDAVDNRFKL